MSRWFRMYPDAMRNPKVARLIDRDFRMWINLLSVAAENDGAIPPLEDLKHLVSARLDHLSCAVDRLIRAGLIDELADGYKPHNWDKFQYKSDTSKDRVTLHRARRRNNGVTPPDTEADTECSDTKVSGAKAPLDPDQLFWSNAKAFLGVSKAALVGKWCGQYGRDATAAAITQAQINRAVDAVPYIEAILRKPKLAVVGGAGHSGVPL